MHRINNKKKIRINFIIKNRKIIFKITRKIIKIFKINYKLYLVLVNFLLQKYIIKGFS